MLPRTFGATGLQTCGTDRWWTRSVDRASLATVALAGSAVLALAMAGSGWAADPGGLEPSSEQTDATNVSPYYRIGPDDQLRIVVRGEGELSGSYPVRPDGRITLPLLDPVEAVGKTPPDLAALLEDQIGRAHV